ncbi:helix-turn-helix domain-containing protein [Halalkalicoccus sp. NIPERK01]|uniref:helix-turn-helix domain-containing protein n=1 Tax=Halalkalicoccus sp. NIPERK01 TaxID=3053469 RepID=UPI00256F1E52|nr:helix-turn-helix domain-containing protein [Halalkalicoccus sp. NIPERK01]MDL5361096.1 helix-turn-helix domain-containing protein [Halalkalicoccus sp. NIPERK01]
MYSGDVLLVLGNEYNAEILGATDEPRSAQALSDELDIPIATCYRRIEELEEADLLEHQGRVLSEERRRVSVYRRTVDRIVVNFDDGNYTVNVAGRADVKNKLDEVWRSLSTP